MGGHLEYLPRKRGVGGEPGEWGGGPRAQAEGQQRTGPALTALLSSLSQNSNTVGKSLYTVRGGPSGLGRNYTEIISGWLKSLRTFSGEGFLSLPFTLTHGLPLTSTHRYLPSQPPLPPGPAGPLPLNLSSVLSPFFPQRLPLPQQGGPRLLPSHALTQPCY